MGSTHRSAWYAGRMDGTGCAGSTTSPRHRAAFLRLSVAWRRADELKKLAPLSGVVDPDLLDPARWKTEPSDRCSRMTPLLVRPRMPPARNTPVANSARRCLHRQIQYPQTKTGLRHASIAHAPTHRQTMKRTCSRMKFPACVASARSQRRACSGICYCARYSPALGGIGAWYAVEQRNTQTYADARR